MSNPTFLFFPQYDSIPHHLEPSKSNALLQYGSFFGFLHFYCMLIKIQFFYRYNIIEAGKTVADV
jgi:hypothetical protein